MKGLRIAVLAASLAAAACAPTPPAPTPHAPTPPKSDELPVPPQRIVLRGYSFMPLNERGWQVSARGAYQLTLGRPSVNPDEAFAIHTSIFRLPDFKSHGDMVRTIKDGQAANIDKKRYALLKHDVNPERVSQAQCVRSYAISEEKSAPKGTARSSATVLEVMALICAHPKDKAFGVNVDYSYWHYPGQRDPEFAAKADQLLKSIEFTDP